MIDLKLSKFTQIIIILALGMLAKLSALHYTMGINAVVFITVKNFLLAVCIYCVVCLLSPKNKLRSILIVNTIISTIFFIDAMYFSHFYTLVPAHSIYQVGQLGPVSDSIVGIFNPLYLLFFLDNAVVIYLVKRKKEKVVFDLSKKSLLATLVVTILVVSGLNIHVARKTEKYFTPYNMGVINYHLYDIASSIDRSTINIEQVQAFSTIAVNEEASDDYFGLAEGKNVIVMLAESLQSFVINEKIDGQYITPVLNELIDNESIYFDRFYEQVAWGNTSDSEFLVHNGYYPSPRIFSYKAYEGNDFVTLPWLLKERGYSTLALHANYGYFWYREQIYPSQGIDTFISLEDFDEGEFIVLGLSDRELFSQSIPILEKQPRPFYSFYITVTNHHPFFLPEEHKELDIPEHYEETVLGKYLHTVRYLDTQIGLFIEDLKERDLYDDSIIIIYGDHKGLDMRDEDINESVSSFLGKPYEEDEMYRVPLIIHMPGEGMQKTVSTAGGQIDFFPTVANLLGIELKEDSNFGKDLLNIENGFVAIAPHVAPGSFIDNEKIFIMSNDGIFENSRAWNKYTGDPVELEECRAGFQRAINELRLSDYIMRNNLVGEAQREGISNILLRAIPDNER